MKTQEGLEVTSQTVETVSPRKEKKESHLVRNLLIIIFILMLLIALGAAGFVMFAFSDWSGKTELDLVKNIGVEDLGLEGYDGEGILKYDEAYLAALIDYPGTSGKVKEFIRSVSYTVSPDTDISNGDTITVKAEFSDDDARRAGVKVTKDTKHLVIESLDEKDEEGYNYGDTEGSTESTDTFDDPEDDYLEGGDRDYTDNDMYSGGGVTYVTKTAAGEDGYINVREEKSTDSDVVVKLSNGIRVDVCDPEGGWYKVATGPYKGCYIHESALSD